MRKHQDGKLNFLLLRNFAEGHILLHCVVDLPKLPFQELKSLKSE
jgi:hypothetical protein